MKPGPKRKPFDSYVDKTGDCWIWLGKLNKWGYGSFCRDRRTVMAHRVSYEQIHGQLPAGSILMHICDNPACVRPDHLRVGTHQLNQADKVAKGRQAKGEKIAASKLTEKLVREIREKHIPRKVTYEMLASEYGVCKDTIRKAVNGIYWSHLA